MAPSYVIAQKHCRKLDDYFYASDQWQNEEHHFPNSSKLRRAIITHHQIVRTSSEVRKTHESPLCCVVFSSFAFRSFYISRSSLSRIRTFVPRLRLDCCPQRERRRRRRLFLTLRKVVHQRPGGNNIAALHFPLICC